MTVRIALLQAEAVPLDPERNLAVIREAATAARAAGAELLLTPELFVSGYAPELLAGWLTAERVADFPAALAGIAMETGLAVAAGFPAARAGGGFVIAAGLWDAAGAELLRYEKVHLWGDAERRAFVPADAAPGVAAWNGLRVGFQICYDIEFPEPARLLAERGADLVLVPTAIDADSAYVPEVIVRARAAENGFVVAYADHAGADEASADGPPGFAGLSIVAGREGRVLGRAGAGSELLIADLPDPTAPRVADYLRDRRPGVYAGWR
ncbi:nitrilase-related carbon-nitrogen hydrolase [Leucobacter sp. wl10]|uniref:nitrilase-related carbon-nitrogen hydrolase n=1 Tax=Leucobacter sp. wl10 TaxID=2304677 RepID=UPI001F09448E|nr:nitrilase-related carbon-nitrogen hydrolase [Leucobacter sp. wl10]